VTIDCTKIQSITREKTAYVVPNAILICTDEEKVSITKYYVTVFWSKWKSVNFWMKISFETTCRRSLV